MRFPLAGLLLPASLLCLPLLACAQAVNDNPAQKDAPVFLDNHRPPTKKKDKAPTTRTLSGKVVDVNGNPLTGALVTLTDTRTNVKNTFITKADGRYQFEDLSFSIDYELQARFKEFNADMRKISQYDHNPNAVRILQIDDSANASAAKPANSSPAPKN
jgi:hypothetical protein